VREEFGEKKSLFQLRFAQQELYYGELCRFEKTLHAQAKDSQSRCKTFKNHRKWQVCSSQNQPQSLARAQEQVSDSPFDRASGGERARRTQCEVDAALRLGTQYCIGMCSERLENHG
jgi:hypothetical protein